MLRPGIVDVEDGVDEEPVVDYRLPRYFEGAGQRVLSRVTTSSNPEGDLDLPRTALQIPSGYPTFDVDDSPVGHPTKHRHTRQRRVTAG